MYRFLKKVAVVCLYVVAMTALGAGFNYVTLIQATNDTRVDSERVKIARVIGYEKTFRLDIDRETGDQRLELVQWPWLPPLGSRHQYTAIHYSGSCGCVIGVFYSDGQTSRYVARSYDGTAIELVRGQLRHVGPDSYFDDATRLLKVAHAQYASIIPQ